MHQFVQIFGSLLVLAGFALTQKGVLAHNSALYLVLNVIGSALLAVEAVLSQQWGFLLLEGVWACVSAAGLASVLLGKKPAVADG